MNNKHAKNLSETITNEALYLMLKNASKCVKDWAKPSKANATISRGANWNLFCKDFEVNKKYSSILKYRMIQEFGDFLEEEYKTIKNHKPQVKTNHSEPDLTKFK